MSLAEGAGALGTARRLVLKIGSALLVDEASGRPALAWLETLAQDVAEEQAHGRQVLIVSSGAVALGRGVLGPAMAAGAKLRLEEKQAAAAAGQVRLMAAYETAFAKHGLRVAQALLTPEDTERRRRWLNARATLETLLGLNVCPVVNENDTVATEELRYGDNDRLAARVAQMIGADALILLSDVDGLYTADPRRDPAATHVPRVRAMSPAIEAMAGGANLAAGTGTGGMRTKIEAAKIALSAGCATAIMQGAGPHPLRRLREGARATWFEPAASPEAARRAWLAGTLTPAGSYVVDSGAAAALARGASLLPAGVTGVEGRFDRGDAVRVCGPGGAVLAHGVSAYSAADAAKIIGRRSEDTETLLGYRGRPALIHRDDLVLLAGGGAARGDGIEQ